MGPACSCPETAERARATLQPRPRFTLTIPEDSCLLTTWARVYLADLRHNFSGMLANDCMPLGVAYMKAVMDRDLPGGPSPACSPIPDRLLDALEAAPPDVLMLSNYMWNEWLSFHFATRRQAPAPGDAGGDGRPEHLPRARAPARRTSRAHPEIDLYVLGEGDFLAARGGAASSSPPASRWPRFGEREVPSRHLPPPTASWCAREMWDREQDIEDIPSPWLGGALDEFFDGKLAPLLETNRGCPFTCTFCVQGVRWYTKVHNFTKDRLREEIEYIGALHQGRAARRWASCASPTRTTACSSATSRSPSYIGEAQRSTAGRPTSTPPPARTVPSASSSRSRRSAARW